jgi:REP element-mobilizing transposase RayT
MRELPTRKPNRLKGHDYCQSGAYFITICTKDRAELFGTIVGAATCRPYAELTELGKSVDDVIGKINYIYKHVSVEQYVIMPNHIHMIVVIGNGGRQIAAPTISLIVGNLKRVVSMRSGFSPWQKSFHDHIIRNENEYNKIAEYIENNPILWIDDCFYTR